MIEYRDFILIAENVVKDEDQVVRQFTVSVFDSPVGQGEKKETVTIPDELIKLIRRLENRKLDDHVQSQMDLGEVLAGLLLPDYARRLFGESLKRLREGEGLRLRLRLADELADFPWEYMYIQDQRGERTPSSFLALDPRISIVRHEAIAVPGDWFEGTDHRRLVVAMATPEPYATYPKLHNLPSEQALIKEALKGMPGLRAVFLPDYPASEGNTIPGATLKDLMGAFMDKTDIFHFSGHGEFVGELGPAFGSVIGEGGIVLAGTDNQAVPIAADRLAELVLRGKGTRLVVLGACETGRRDGHNVWSSVVASLLKAGIPAVVAMQFTVKDKLAAAFSGAFYQALVAGCTLDEAVALGRGAMRAEALSSQPDIRDWGVPVLYLRAQGARVFNPVRDEQARTRAEQALTELRVKQQLGTVDVTGRVLGAAVGAMASGALKVEQEAAEVKGVIIGANVFVMKGGKLTVQQKFDTVSKDVTGLRIGALGEAASQLESEDTVIQDLEDRLGLQAEPRPGGTPQETPRSGPRPPQQSGTRPSQPLETPSQHLCPTCRNRLNPEDKFCRSCGTPVVMELKFCPQCGAKIAPGAHFCDRCGGRLR